MLLDTPITTKRDGYSCGAVALSIVYEFNGFTLPRAYWNLSNPARGMAPETAEAAIRAAFAGVAWGQGWEVEDLIHHLRRNRPVMCLVSEEEASDHWITVRGWHGGRIHYHDSEHGRESKPAQEFLGWWTGPKDNSYQRFGLTGWLS